MFKKYLIVASNNNPASVNIVKNLSQFRTNPVISSIQNSANFDIYTIEGDVLHEENLDLEKINKYDFIIFPCTHRSEKGEKSLSIHSPGNWREANLGGKDNKASNASALFNKHLFENLHKNAKIHELADKYSITLEVTHHGPFIPKPSVFIEIGSSESEWNDRRAGFVIAKTIVDTIEEFKENPYREVAIGIGGPHYCPNFNIIQEVSNVAIAHIIPNYASPITEEMIRQALAKTLEEVDFALIDWKGLGTSEQRKQVLDILDRLYISWKRTSDITR